MGITVRRHPHTRPHMDADGGLELTIHHDSSLHPSMACSRQTSLATTASSRWTTPPATPRCRPSGPFPSTPRLRCPRSRLPRVAAVFPPVAAAGVSPPAPSPAPSPIVPVPPVHRVHPAPTFPVTLSHVRQQTVAAGAALLQVGTDTAVPLHVDGTTRAHKAPRVPAHVKVRAAFAVTPDGQSHPPPSRAVPVSGCQRMGDLVADCVQHLGLGCAADEPLRQADGARLVVAHAQSRFGRVEREHPVRGQRMAHRLGCEEAHGVVFRRRRIQFSTRSSRPGFKGATRRFSSCRSRRKARCTARVYVRCGGAGRLPCSHYGDTCTRLQVVPAISREEAA